MVSRSGERPQMINTLGCMRTGTPALHLAKGFLGGQFSSDNSKPLDLKSGRFVPQLGKYPISH